MGIIAFASAADADRLVAGLPAAARAVREASAAGLVSCTVAAPGWTPAARTRIECERLGECETLGESLELAFAPLETLAIPPGALLIAGDRAPAAALLRAGHDGEGLRRASSSADGSRAVIAELLAGDSAPRFAAQARAVLRATAKSTDGIVSRHINRPISRAFSRVFLAIPGMQPLYATFGTGFLALLMVASLLRGDNWGLVTGALLFQAASIFDGVDGEIARATFRATRTGAAVDSLIDAVTNLAFICGVAINLQMQGDQFSARIGFTGLALLAIGLILIGRASAKSNAPFSFDVVKEHYRARSGDSQPSRLLQGLTFLTSRDFFALAFALLIAIGMAAQVLALFAIAAAGWLVAVILALVPKHA